MKAERPRDNEEDDEAENARDSREGFHDDEPVSICLARELMVEGDRASQHPSTADIQHLTGNKRCLL